MANICCRRQNTVMLPFCRYWIQWYEAVFVTWRWQTDKGTQNVRKCTCSSAVCSAQHTL